MLFKKKSPAGADLSWLKTDLHSHLIPRIDDGSPDMPTSLALIRGLHALGYRKLITTPHILWQLYSNTSQKINEGFANLQEAVLEAGIDLGLRAAAEYFIDDHFQSELKNKTPLLTISANMVLVEFSMVNAPLDLHDVLFEMQMQNYQPILAHPERYTYFSRKKEFFDDLKNSGCLFQLNLLAIGGYYGPSVQELAEYLLKKNYYDFAGTDLHHEKHLSALRKLPASQLKKLREAGSIKNDSL
jgi:protein-tyrosine phosphatase